MKRTNNGYIVSTNYNRQNIIIEYVNETYSICSLVSTDSAVNTAQLVIYNNIVYGISTSLRKIIYSTNFYEYSTLVDTSEDIFNMLVKMIIY